MNTSRELEVVKKCGNHEQSVSISVASSSLTNSVPSPTGMVKEFMVSNLFMKTLDKAIIEEASQLREDEQSTEYHLRELVEQKPQYQN